MSKPIRNKLGQFRTYPKSAFDAGWDSVISGPDMANCHFGWFLSPESTKEWERGRDAAKSKSRTKFRANTQPKSELALVDPLNKRKNNERI